MLKVRVDTGEFPELTTYRYRGELCWLAVDVARAMGAMDPKGSAYQWRRNMKPGRHFLVVKAGDLGADAPVELASTQEITVFFARGVFRAAMVSDLPGTEPVVEYIENLLDAVKNEDRDEIARLTSAQAFNAVFGPLGFATTPATDTLFPPEWFALLYRLHGLADDGSNRHPMCFAHFTRRALYERLDIYPALRELRAKYPDDTKLHQLLNENRADLPLSQREAFREFLRECLTVMRSIVVAPVAHRGLLASFYDVWGAMYPLPHGQSALGFASLRAKGPS